MSDVFRETFHFLEMPDGPRFAVITHPNAPPTGTGIVLCSGGWFSGSWNFNRMYVRLARSLAARGHMVVRFDWYGSGESPGYLVRFHLEEPSAEDVIRVASLLDKCERIVGAGVCFGATSLLSAAQRIDHLEAVVLIAAMVPGRRRDTARQITPRAVFRSALRPSVVKGWFDPYRRRLYLKWFRTRRRALYRRIRRKTDQIRDGSLAIQIQGLVSRGISMYFLYGESDANLPAFSVEPLASITASEHVRVEVVPFDVGSSNKLEAQEETCRVITSVVERVTGN